MTPAIEQKSGVSRGGASASGEACSSSLEQGRDAASWPSSLLLPTSQQVARKPLSAAAVQLSILLRGVTNSTVVLPLPLPSGPPVTRKSYLPGKREEREMYAVSLPTAREEAKGLSEEPFGG